MRVALVVAPAFRGTSTSWYCSPASVLYTTLKFSTSASLLSHSSCKLSDVRETTRKFLGASISAFQKRASVSTSVSFLTAIHGHHQPTSNGNAVVIFKLTILPKVYFISFALFTLFLPCLSPHPGPKIAYLILPSFTPYALRECHWPQVTHRVFMAEWRLEPGPPRSCLTL